MGKLLELQCQVADQCIRSEKSDDEIRHHLFELEDVIIFKKVFDEQSLLSLRDAVWEWSLGAPLNTPESSTDTNHHSVEIGVSKLQKTFHIYHAYNFNRILEMPEELKLKLLSIWEPMRELQNRLSGAKADWNLDSENRKLHPQIIQYPCGGGLFSPHTHALEPQRLGLILAISKRGEDYSSGGTGFEWKDRSELDTSKNHDLGDMILFKYNLRHWIRFVDIEQPLQLDSKRGRWTMVLPYY